jgi:hypothetical protein
MNSKEDAVKEDAMKEDAMKMKMKTSDEGRQGRCDESQ